MGDEASVRAVHNWIGSSASVRRPGASLRGHSSEVLEASEGCESGEHQGHRAWSHCRIRLAYVIGSQTFEMAMGMLILANVVLIILETDAEAECFPEYFANMNECPTAGAKHMRWLRAVNLTLLGVYTLEALVRVFVDRENFLKSNWNCLDATIVFIGWLNLLVRDIIKVNFTFLRFLRILRLLRIVRVFIAFRELYLLMHGLTNAIKTIFWGAIMMFALMTVWSIIVVDFVHPYNSKINYPGCDRCSKGFKSVMECNLTLFQQIVAGDSWGAISVPVILHHPWMAVILITIVFTVSLGLMNLMFAVVVERAAEARDKDEKMKVRQLKLEEEAQKKRMVTMCQQLDKNGDGTLSLDELLAAYDTVEDFRNAMELVDIHKEELGAVYKLLDMDHSGDVSYVEFCDQLHHMRTGDMRTTVSFMKLSMAEVRDCIKELANNCAQLSEKVLHQHTAAAQQHSELLESIDCRLNRLSIPGSCPRDVVDNPLLGQKLLASTDLAAPPLCADRIKKRIGGLSQQTRELADTQRSILRRAEQQALTMGHHASMLHAMQNSVGEREERVFQTKDNQLLAQVEEALVQLQDNTREDLASLTQNIEKKLQEGQTVLERNMRILANLRSQLDCPEPFGGSCPSEEPKAQTLATSRGGDPQNERQNDWGHPHVLPFCGCATVNKQAPMQRPSKWAETVPRSGPRSKGVNASQH